MPSLPSCMEDADYQPYVLTWQYQGYQAGVLNLTGATLTGVIHDPLGVGRAVVGVLTITDATAGIFEWALDDADVATPGSHKVQFNAAFAGSKDQKTLVYDWEIKDSLEVA